MDSSAGKSKSGFVENRSIDFIPENERHGSIFAQFTLWFGANLQITAIVTGALAVVLGGDVFWSIIGLFIGQCFGAAVMALHAAQGPKLGLPQMISSRGPIWGIWRMYSHHSCLSYVYWLYGHW